ncbi:MAG: P-II family nitrogen regulator [Deltaproteobacteria bacterium]|nr:P-II family nitrogen regulator [Deltaproteobacteria bacterium]MCL5892617.1 P-II family nitrogen regulator [Deltaproteobacteria bacterium]
MESKFEENIVEIIAIIRRHKIQETKDALDKEGFSQMTFYSVHGRGKQKGSGGLASELDPGLNLINNKSDIADNDYSFLPKRMISLVAPAQEADKIVKTIVGINSTGHYGDGKIFVVPVRLVERIRTAEEGLYAVS